MRTAALVVAVLLSVACTAVVSKKLGDRPDAASDASSDAEMDLPDVEGDPEPDFDTDACGLWGRVYIVDETQVNINTADPTMDGFGQMGMSVFSFDSEEAPISVNRAFDDIDALEGTFYCMPPEVLGEVTEGYVVALLYDTISHMEEDQYVQYQALQTDPLTLTLFLLSIRSPGIDYSTYTDMYWDGASGNRFDIPVTVRISKLPIEVSFDGFTYSTGRRARLCVYAVGVREDTTFNFEAIGASFRDLTDGDVQNGTTLDDLSVNIAAKPGQQYKVFVYYIQARDRFEDLSTYLMCGDSDTPRSCELGCGVMTDPVGTHISETLSYTIGPVTGTCDLDELSVCP